MLSPARKMASTVNPLAINAALVDGWTFVVSGSVNGERSSGALRGRPGRRLPIMVSQQSACLSPTNEMGGVQVVFGLPLFFNITTNTDHYRGCLTFTAVGINGVQVSLNAHASGCDFESWKVFGHGKFLSALEIGNQHLGLTARQHGVAGAFKITFGSTKSDDRVNLIGGSAIGVSGLRSDEQLVMQVLRGASVLDVLNVGIVVFVQNEAQSIAVGRNVRVGANESGGFVTSLACQFEKLAGVESDNLTHRLPPWAAPSAPCDTYLLDVQLLVNMFFARPKNNSRSHRLADYLKMMGEGQ